MSAFETYRTRVKNNPVIRLAGTTWTIREGGWGIEVWHGKLVYGTFSKIWAAKRACIFEFLESEEARQKTAIPIIKRLLQESDELWFKCCDKTANVGKALGNALVALEQDCR